jgi:hypothetical protein
MKKIHILLLSAIVIASCNSNPGKITVKSDGGKSTATVDLNSAEKNTQQMQNKAEELKKLAPLSVDQLKGLLPEELAGIKRSTYNASTSMGFAVGEAEYRKDDNTSIKLVVYDCAGEAGSAFYSMSYWMKMNMQSESDNGYTKTVDLSNGKAVETYDKSSNRYTLVYLGNDRILVSLEGDNVPLETIRDAVKSLNMKVS